MKLRLISLIAALTLLGLSVGCLYPDHGRGREEHREPRHEERREQGHDREHDERHGPMQGFAL
jgi:hypothetical protein